jgi:hypothetical protein
MGVVIGSLLVACGETYCQSGAKYGAQCMSRNDIEMQETQVRGETEDRRLPINTDPLPGCVMATPSGLVRQPPPSSSAGQPATGTALWKYGGSYVVSGACVPSRQPSYGSVR